ASSTGSGATVLPPPATVQVWRRAQARGSPTWSVDRRPERGFHARVATSPHARGGEAPPRSRDPAVRSPWSPIDPMTGGRAGWVAPRGAIPAPPWAPAGPAP